MCVHTFNHSNREAELYELEASLFYKSSSRIARAVKPCLKETKTKRKRTGTEKK